jgi:hypothetical protein
MATNVTPVVTYTPAQGDAIIRNQYKYVWRITYRDGEVVNQLDGDGGERKLDFFRPIAEASWVPTRSGLQEASVALLPGQQLILARRTFQLMNGTHFIASYLLGVEQLKEDGTLKRVVWFISPPAEGLAVREESGPDGKKTKCRVALNFPGAVEKAEGSHAEFLSAAQKWVNAEKPLVMA